MSHSSIKQSLRGVDKMQSVSAECYVCKEFTVRRSSCLCIDQPLCSACQSKLGLVCTVCGAEFVSSDSVKTGACCCNSFGLASVYVFSITLFSFIVGYVLNSMVIPPTANQDAALTYMLSIAYGLLFMCSTTIVLLICMCFVGFVKSSRR